MLTLVLTESAIELVPKEIHGHPSIKASTRRKGKPASEIILDQSYHHSALLKLPYKGVGRGRPDITHISLLMALGSPLNMIGQLRCYVHTRDNFVISIDPKTRLPRTTERFVSLLEQLYKESQVPKDNEPLLTMKPMTLADLVKSISPDNVVALTTLGIPLSLTKITEGLTDSKTPVVLIGGFQSGHFSETVNKLVGEKYSIDSRSLEASTVVARLVYEYENAMGIQRFH